MPDQSKAVYPLGVSLLLILGSVSFLFLRGPLVYVIAAIIFIAGVILVLWGRKLIQEKPLTPEAKGEVRKRMDLMGFTEEGQAAREKNARMVLPIAIAIFPGIFGFGFLNDFLYRENASTFVRIFAFASLACALGLGSIVAARSVRKFMKEFMRPLM